MFAWVDADLRRNNTEEAAKAYLNFLFTDEAQERRSSGNDRQAWLSSGQRRNIKKYFGRLPKLDLFLVTLVAKNWDDAQQKFFADNGIIDRVLKPEFR
jgi:sulfate/thiosulfate transport system substrate-binding protein